MVLTVLCVVSATITLSQITISDSLTNIHHTDSLNVCKCVSGYVYVYVCLCVGVCQCLCV